jgi:uncharacterized SAM-binding protein YcdF (DUF218 family)
MMNNKEALQHAEKIFRFLHFSETPRSADAIIGFGHFDLKIPLACANLYNRNFSGHIIFTGGVGAGSIGFLKPEAQEFADFIAINNYHINPNSIIIEDKSTNTSENIENTKRLLELHYTNLKFGEGIKSVILVANAYRQLRVVLTWKKLVPSVPCISCPPKTIFSEEFELFRSKGEDYISLLIGEVHRIIEYPKKEWMLSIPIPSEIKKSYELLSAIYH